nr:hypothetical protein [uncultured Draconibacterium sp.]
MASKTVDKKKLTDSKNAYNLEDEDLKKVEGSVKKTESELRNEIGASRSKEIKLEKRIEDYPKGATLYAPINKAIIVINNGQYQFVGTRFESFLRETIFEMREVNLESYCQTNAFPQDFDINNFKEFLESHKLNYYHKNTPGHRLYQAFWNYIINVPDEPYIKSIYDNIKSKLNE